MKTQKAIHNCPYLGDGPRRPLRPAVLLEIAVEEKLNLEFVGAEESRQGVVIGPRSKMLAFWVTARGMHKATWEVRGGRGCPASLNPALCSQGNSVSATYLWLKRLKSEASSALPFQGDSN